MEKLYGKNVTKKELLRNIGDMSQIAGIKQYELTSGKAKGVSAIDVKTGSGFQFTVLPDRGMDIAWCDYKGIPISFISKTGIVSPQFYEPESIGFLRSFYAGLLTTCGLTYMGSPCEDEEKSLGLHGRASNIPADNVSIYQEWENNDFVMKIRGQVRESCVFGENIVLTREISTKLGYNKLTIRDTVENEGYIKQPLMLLYHFNFGYPIVSTDTILIKSNGSIKARDGVGKKGLETFNVFQEPTHNYAEQVFYHDLTPNQNGWVYAGLYNKKLNTSGLGVYVKAKKEQLPKLIQWKQMGEGDYVVGLEPSTWYPEGRKKARERGELDFIAPGEIKHFELEVGIVENMEEYSEAK